MSVRFQESSSERAKIMFFSYERICSIGKVGALEVESKNITPLEEFHNAKVKSREKSRTENFIRLPKYLKKKIYPLIIFFQCQISFFHIRTCLLHNSK